jgi:hypothetical protein
VVRDAAVDGEALVGTKREGHDEPRRERIVGGEQLNRKAEREGKGGKADPPRAARWCLAPLHFPSGLHLGRGPSLHAHVGISRPQSAREMGLLHVVIGPNIL